MAASHGAPGLDQLGVTFDDTHAVASAGLLLPATLADRLGIAQAADEHIRHPAPALPILVPSC